MRLIALVVTLACVSLAAKAQNVNLNCLTGTNAQGYPTWVPASAATPCPVTPVSTPSAPVYTRPGTANHTPIATFTLAAGPGPALVVVTAGQIVTGCDLTFSGGGPFTLAYTTAASPGIVTASATVGLQVNAGQSYHCPTSDLPQGISVYNTSSTTAGLVAVDVY